ncbi:hypothetical protein B0H13DRAFT_1924357 [Mycena leptocephala]|nr:hypothetical protein B0H13DRAFT_1924357 [Mycena leptocephala]
MKNGAESGAMPTTCACTRPCQCKQKRRETQRQRELTKLTAIQTKREQWKAASARYYERHPEVKEKKRQRSAEKRAAKKLARHRWDPPKIPKRPKPLGIVPDTHPPSDQHRTRQQQQLGKFTERPDIDLSPDEHYSPAPYEETLNFFAASWRQDVGSGSCSEGGLSGDSTNPNAQIVAGRVHSREAAAVESLLFLSSDNLLAAVPIESSLGSSRQPEADQGSHGRMLEGAWDLLAPDCDSRFRVLSKGRLATSSSSAGSIEVNATSIEVNATSIEVNVTSIEGENGVLRRGRGSTYLPGIS